MKFVKIVFGLVLSFYLIFGLVAGILVGSSLGVQAVGTGSTNTNPATQTSPAPNSTPKPSAPAATNTPPSNTLTTNKTPPKGKALGVDLNDALGFKACNISGRDASTSANALQVCVKAVLQFALTMAGIIAIIQLGVAAFNYFNPDVSEDVVKQSIDTIRNIFIGLMLIAAPVIILRTFNVSLTNFGFLGFTASTGNSSQNGGSKNSTDTNAGPVTIQIGGITLSPTDTAANINSVTQALDKVKSGEISPAELIQALNYTLGNVDLKSSTLDIAAIGKLIDSVKMAGIGYTPDSNFLAALNSSGSNSDGNQNANQASYCSTDNCTIISGKVNPGSATTQTLTVNLKNKNGVQTDYILTLKPINVIPSPVSNFMSLTPSTTGGNPSVTITKSSISSSEFSQWCSAAQTQSGSGGGSACIKSPASSGTVIIAPPTPRAAA